MLASEMVEAVSKMYGTGRPECSGKPMPMNGAPSMMDQLGREDGADFGVGDGGVVRGSQ